jgi:hypothetical protein
MRVGIAALTFILATLYAHGQSDLLRRFPAVKGSDLNGRSVSLPGDFPGPASLVFVAFEMRQQDDVDSWRPFILKLQKGDPSLAVLELPTLSRGYLLMRFVVDNGMRSGIRETEARASTITLYLDVKDFTRSLGLQTTQQIAFLVVKPSGEILAQTAGRYSEEGAAEISRGLERVR